VDYYGLHHALRPHRVYAGDVRYTGLDIVPWNYQDSLGRGSVFFLEQDVTGWDKLDEATYNVIIFPKSIGEFSRQVFDHVKNMLKDSTFKRDQVCLACSLMDRGKESNIKRFAELARTMTADHGFTATKNPTSSWYFPKDQGIRGLYSDWIFPNDILDFLKELAEHCPKFELNGKSCRNDCSNLNRWPILKTGRIAYQALGLRR
jgi:hypothetical protein